MDDQPIWPIRSHYGIGDWLIRYSFIVDSTLIHIPIVFIHSFVGIHSVFDLLMIDSFVGIFIQSVLLLTVFIGIHWLIGSIIVIVIIDDHIIHYCIDIIDDIQSDLILVVAGIIVIGNLTRPLPRWPIVVVIHYSVLLLFICW